MSISIRRYTPELRVPWDAFVERSAHGSPFHLTAWMRSIEETFGYRPHYLAAVDSAGGIVGVLPLFLVENLLMGKVLISTPFAVYGGVLSDSDQARDALRDEAAALGKSLAVEFIDLRNAWPEQCVGFSPVTRYVTFTQTIGPDSEAILEAIPRKTRYMVRKALKHPFSVRQTRETGAFFDLYSQSLRRLGTPSFPKRHFHNLLKHFENGCQIREILLEGKVVAAVMSFFFRDQLLPFYGASDPAFNSFAVNNYMYYELMEWGGRNGFRSFDFGRSKMETGSFEFKAHWGMETRPLPYEMLLVKRTNLPDFTPKNPRFQFAIKAWQRLPLPVTRILGPALIRLVP
jgi:FemAB-related protein (PEP-CTERM system-associated)